MQPAKLTASDGVDVHYYRWLPEGEVAATIHIAHGMGEHAARYDAVAQRLTDAGYAVYADDHRGHGQTSPADALGDMGSDGWNRVIRDLLELHEHMATAHPGVPRGLVGHSMGAMLTQQFIARHGGGLDAVVISGSPGFSSAFQLWVSHMMARIERWRVGAGNESERMQSALFGDANTPFDAPDATGFEWLSRDADEVRKYVDDELCGFVLRAGSLCDMFAGAREARRKKSIAAIPSSLPIYVFSGSADPVHGEEKGLQNLVSGYRSQVNQLDYKLYPEGRHEMLNEVNKDEVITDLVDWLDRNLKR
ncbi:MAG: alpha/beta hydrolase [Gammaproteobacteria bacterium]|nr:alpha/beta hydrolase [Gammaproteobacteria bacterium]